MIDPIHADPVASELLAGFIDPVFDAQAVFRAVLTANAYPGRIGRIDTPLIPPAPFDRATGAMALTLLDMETSLWLDPAAVAARCWLGFHAGVPVVADHADARFVIVTDPASLPRLTEFAQGSDEYPDRSATLIVQLPSFESGKLRTWRGPGINGSIQLSINGLTEDFWSDRALSQEVYPAGIDIFFTCGSALIGLPRTTIVEG